MHFHANEHEVANDGHALNLKTHIAEFNSQEIIETPQVIGSIFKVASGVKRNLLIDIDILLLVCVLVFSLLVLVSQFRAYAFNFLFHQQVFYSPHSPRAPPR